MHLVLCVYISLLRFPSCLLMSVFSFKYLYMHIYNGCFKVLICQSVIRTKSGSVLFYGLLFFLGIFLFFVCYLVYNYIYDIMNNNLVEIMLLFQAWFSSLVEWLCFVFLQVLECGPYSRTLQSSTEFFYKGPGSKYLRLLWTLWSLIATTQVC